MDLPDSNLYDLPSWSFVDPFDDRAFRLHASANTSDEQLLSTMPVSPFGLPSWDQLDSHIAHELGGDSDANRNPAKSGYTYNYPDRSARFSDCKHAAGLTLVPDEFTPDLDDLLRSTSQLATERALYMTVGSPSTTTSAMSMSMPMLDACSSPGGSHLSSGASEAEADADADWERDLSAVSSVYRLPDPVASTSAAFYPAPFYPQQQAYATAENNGLTPLEMPDGSTRFTSNWLPVDPEGGFTIHAAATATPSPFSPCPLEYPDSVPEAFISVGRRVDSTAG